MRGALDPASRSRCCIGSPWRVTCMAIETSVGRPAVHRQRFGTGRKNRGAGCKNPHLDCMADAAIEGQDKASVGSTRVSLISSITT